MLVWKTCLLRLQSLDLEEFGLAFIRARNGGKAIAEAFGLESELIPFAAVPVGYPDTKDIKKERFEPERIRWEQVKSE